MPTATNPTTGEKYAWVAGKWIPVPGTAKAETTPPEAEDAGPGVVERYITGPVKRGAGAALGAAGVGLNELGLIEPETAADLIVKGGQLEKSAPRTPEDEAATAAITEAPTFLEGAKAAVSNPGALVRLGVESLPQSAPSLILGALGALGGPAGVAAGVGAGSYAAEYASSMADVLREAGANPERPEDVAAALRDQNIMAQARERALKRGLPVAAFDALSGGLAGRLVAGATGAGSFVGRSAGEAAMQGGLGAAGEAGAQQATGEYKPGAIIAEGAAEMPGGVVETAIGAAGHRRGRSPAPAVSDEDAELLAIGRLPDDQAVAAIREKYGVNGIKARKVLRTIREEGGAEQQEQPTSAPADSSAVAGPKGQDEAAPTPPSKPKTNKGQSEAIAEKAKANAAAMLRGKWLPIRESEDEDSPIVGYVNEETGEQRTVEEHRAGAESPLSGLEPVLPAPEEIAEQVTAARKEAEKPDEKPAAEVKPTEPASAAAPVSVAIEPVKPSLVSGSEPAVETPPAPSFPADLAQEPDNAPQAPGPEEADTAAAGVVAPIEEAGTGGREAAAPQRDEVADGAREEGAAGPAGGVGEAPAEVGPAPAVEEGTAGGQADAAEAVAGPIKPPIKPPERLKPAASWVVVDKATGESVREIQRHDIAEKADRDKYDVVPVGEYLGKLNQTIRDAGGVQPPVAEPAAPNGIARNRARKAAKEDPTAPHMDSAREFVRGSKPLTPANLAKHLDVKPAVAKDVLKKLVAKAEIRQNKDLAYRRKPVQKKPQTFTQFAASLGGLETRHRAEVPDAPRLVPGYGPLFRKGGIDPDKLREAAIEAGYAREDADTNDVLRMLDDENRGRRHHRGADEAEVEAEREKHAAERDREQYENARQEATEAASGAGIALNDAETHEAALHMLSDGMTADVAVEWVAMSGGVEFLDDNPTISEPVPDDDIPLDFAPVAQAEPDEGSQVGGEAGARERAPEGDAGAEQGSRPAGPERAESAGEVAPRAEKGAEGLDQFVLPGAERSAQQAMDARKGRGQTAKAPQKPADEGIFAPPKDERQRDIEAPFQALRVASDSTRPPSIDGPIRLAANVFAGNLSDPEMRRIREEVAAGLKPLLQRLAGDRARLEVSDAIRGRTADGQALSVGGVQVRDLIGIALLDGQNLRPREEIEGTVRHEAVHLLRETGAIPPTAWAALEAKAPGWRKSLGIDEEPGYAGLSEDAKNEEAIAEAYARWKRGTLKIAGSPLAGLRVIGRFLDGLRGIVAKALGLPKLPRPEEVFQAIEAGAYSGRSGPEAALAQGGVDGTARRHAELLGDLVRTQAFREEGLGFLDVPSKRMVLSRVFAVAQEPKVLRAVVSLLPVDVVNVLVGPERSAKDLFHDEAMFQDLLASNGDKPVAIGTDAASAAVEAVATVAAKRWSSLRSGELSGDTREGSPALGADADDRHDAIVQELIGNNNRTARLQAASLAGGGALLRDAADPSVFSETERETEGYLRRLFNDDSRSSMAATLDHWRRLWQDRQLPWLRLQQSVERLMRRPLPPEADVYRAEEASYSKTGERLFRLMEDHVKPIVETAKHAGLKRDEIGRYLKARGAEYRNQYIASINPKFPDGGSGMLTKDARKILKDVADGPAEKRAALEKIADLFAAMNKERTSLLVESGRYTPEAIEAWERAYPFYVPYRGVEGDPDPDMAAAAAGSRTGRGFLAGRKGERAATGRSSEAFDPLPMAIAMAKATIVQAEKNTIRQAALNLAQEINDPSVLQVNPRKRQAFMRTLTDPITKEKYRTVGYRHVEDYDSANTMSVWVGGQEFLVKIKDKTLAEAAGRMAGNEIPGLFEKLARITQFLSKSHTMLSPEFLATNFSRDIQTAMVNLGQYKAEKLRRTVLKSVPAAVKGSWHYLATGKADTKWAKLAQDFRADGGATSFNPITDALQEAQEIDSALASLRGGSWQNMKAGGAKLLHAIENANTAIDYGVRLSTYAALRDVVGRAEAASIAKNLTVNFNRRGEYGSALNALYMFANAGIQGTATLATAMYKSKTVRKWVAGAVAVGFMQEIAASLLFPPPEGDDDEDKTGLSAYDRIPEWEKQSNVIIPYGTEPGQYLKVPMPYGYNFFHNLGRLTAAYLRGAPEETGKPVTAARTAARLAGSLGQAFLPIGLIPTIGEPFYEVATNENWQGRKIMPDRYPGDDKPDAYRHFESVSALSPPIAQGLNALTGGDAYKAGEVDISPESIDHVVSFFMGGALNKLAEVASDATKAGASALGLAEETPQFTGANVPFWRRVVGSASPWQIKDITYRRLDEIENLQDRMKGAQNDLKEARDPEAKAEARAALSALRDENRGLLSLDKEASSVRRQLSKMRKERLAILGSDQTPTEKRAKTDALRERERSVLVRFNRTYFAALKRDQAPPQP